MNDELVAIGKKSPGGAPGGFTWAAAGDVVAVPYDLAVELLRIPDGDFYEAAAVSEPPVEAETSSSASDSRRGRSAQ